MGFGDVLSRFQTPLDTGGHVVRYHAAPAYPRRRPAFVVVPELMLPRRIRLPAQQLRHASPSRRLTALDSDRVHLVTRHRHGTTLPPRAWDPLPPRAWDPLPDSCLQPRCWPISTVVSIGGLPASSVRTGHRWRLHRLWLRSFAVGLAVDDQFLCGTLDPVDGRLGEEGVGHLGEELARVRVRQFSTSSPHLTVDHRRRGEGGNRDPPRLDRHIVRRSGAVGSPRGCPGDERAPTPGRTDLEDSARIIRWFRSSRPSEEPRRR